jgi:hypothetical protein
LKRKIEEFLFAGAKGVFATKTGRHEGSAGEDRKVLFAGAKGVFATKARRHEGTRRGDCHGARGFLVNYRYFFMRLAMTLEWAFVSGTVGWDTCQGKNHHIPLFTVETKIIVVF